MRDRSVSCGRPRYRGVGRHYDDYGARPNGRQCSDYSGKGRHYDDYAGKQDRPRDAWPRGDSRARWSGPGARGGPSWRERGGRERERGDDRYRSRDSRCGRSASGPHIDMPSPCIWIGGCPDDVKEREVAKICEKFGPVHHVSIKKSARDTFAFVGFGRMSHAKDAIRGLDQVSAFGVGVVKVAPANRKVRGAEDAEADSRRRSDAPPPPPLPRGGEGRGSGRARSPLTRPRRSRSRPAAAAPRPVRVYLSQLPRDMEEDELQEIATEYGKILQYELHREGAYKCGWVEYASKAEAEMAVSELDERRMDEWSMRLQAYMYPGGET